MKKIITLSLVLLLGSSSFATTSPQTTNTFQTFWDTFKTAVSKKDVDTIARFSKFPIGMSYGIPPIRTKAQLTKRYRQIFNEQTDAAACFAKAKPDMNTSTPSVACPDAAGNEVVLYHFKYTKAGWKFVSLDNLNE